MASITAHNIDIPAVTHSFLVDSLANLLLPIGSAKILLL